ncbi:MAG: helix-turn-helix domain-containing protein, partial [Solirubrobacteraceae bacterium]|nr:helix-turn-helix domain-containing protein [Solirubrobacteraceae bacterium]
RDISVAFADLAAMAIAQARATDGMRQTLRKAVRRNEILRRGAAIDETLAEVAVRGGGLADLASATSAAVRRPVAICDAGHRCRAAVPGGEDAVRQLSTAAQQSQAFRDAVAGLGGPGSVPVATGPFPEAGLPRQLLAPIWIADRRWGYVALAEGEVRLGPLDAHAARHTARHAALLLAAVDRATPGHAGSGAAWPAHAPVRGGGSRGAVAPELGAAQLLVARADPADAERLVQDTLGPLLADHRTGADLLRTLVAFFGTCQSVRDVSRALGVHENTVRYRLGRVRELAGLDVLGSASDQLSVQLALQVLQLRGDLEAFRAS